MKKLIILLLAFLPLLSHGQATVTLGGRSTDTVKAIGAFRVNGKLLFPYYSSVSDTTLFGISVTGEIYTITKSQISNWGTGGGGGSSTWGGITGTLSAQTDLQSALDAKQSTFPSQTGNKIYASPDGTSGTPSFRAAVVADLPSIPLSKLSQSGATNGQAAVWNGSAWAPATVSGGGTPTDTTSLSNRIDDAAMRAEESYGYAAYLDSIKTPYLYVDSAVLSVKTSFILKAKVYLQGAIINNGGAVDSFGHPLMRDNLRASSFSAPPVLPSTDPYEYAQKYIPYDSLAAKYVKYPPQTIPSYQFDRVTDSFNVFSVTGQNAIVDWIFVELRSKNDSTKVVATRAGLLQRDGDIVDVDGVSPLLFPDTKRDSFYVAIRHRNHLAVMTKYPQSLAKMESGIDFTDTLTQLYDLGTFKGQDYTGMAGSRDGTNHFNVMWGGDLNADGKVTTDSFKNDKGFLYNEVVNFPTNSGHISNYGLAFGYLQGDFNMDGRSLYSGSGNDEAFVISSVSFYPLNTGGTAQYQGMVAQIPSLDSIISGGGSGTVTSVTSATSDATVANSTTTPAITIVSAPKLTTARTISATGDLTYNSGSFDGSANVTAAATLATVNSNTGAFSYPSLTVNGKGLITAASDHITTGTGSLVLSNSPVFVTPNLGTPSTFDASFATGTANGFTAGGTKTLKSATTYVDVSASTAPTSGQVLTATSSSAATWQDAAKSTIYAGSTLPAGSVGRTTWYDTTTNQIKVFNPSDSTIVAFTPSDTTQLNYKMDVDAQNFYVRTGATHKDSAFFRAVSDINKTLKASGAWWKIKQIGVGFSDLLYNERGTDSATGNTYDFTSTSPPLIDSDGYHFNGSTNYLNTNIIPGINLGIGNEGIAFYSKGIINGGISNSFYGVYDSSYRSNSQWTCWSNEGFFIEAQGYGLAPSGSYADFLDPTYSNEGYHVISLTPTNGANFIAKVVYNGRTFVNTGRDTSWLSVARTQSTYAGATSSPDNGTTSYLNGTIGLWIYGLGWTQKEIDGINKAMKDFITATKREYVDPN